MIKSLLIYRYVIIIITMHFGFYSYCKSQNLIQNGSFENYTSPIDCIYGGFDNANAPYNHVLNNWFSLNTPDYLNSNCNPSTWHSAPANYYGYINAYNGSSYIGAVFYSGNTSEIKEYIYQNLSQPLQSGKIYCLNFYISRADASRGAIKNIGAYFSPTLPVLNPSMYINANPQVFANSFISDTLNWVLIQGCFTAVGGEQFITIGNFNSNSNTDTMTTASSYSLAANFPGWSYYYIDDIALIDQSTVEISEIYKENRFEVYPNPNNGIFTISGEDIQKIEIINVAGQLLRQESINSKTHQLQINDFTQGIYFIKVNYTNGLSVNKKVIVNP